VKAPVLSLLITDNAFICFVLYLVDVVELAIVVAAG
jgi:hypothetical protein